MSVLGSSGEMMPDRTASSCMEAVARTAPGMSRKGPEAGEMVVIPCPGGAAHPEKAVRGGVRRAQRAA